MFRSHRSGLFPRCTPHRKSTIAKNVKHHIDVLQRQVPALIKSVGFLRQHIEIKSQPVPRQQGVALLDQFAEAINDLVGFIRRHSTARRPIRVFSVPDYRFGGVTGKSSSTGDPKGSVGTPVGIVLRDIGGCFKIEG